VSARPARLAQLGATVAAVPGTAPAERCLVVRAELWAAFRDLAIWIEALCIHEWCLFTERVARAAGQAIDRGQIYVLLTDRPGNRRPLTWERNRVDLLLLEGRAFTCP